MSDSVSNVFNATILDAVNFHCDIFNIVQRRTVKDYELDISIAGNRTIRINNNEYSPITGTVIFRRPGDIVESKGTYSIKGLTLDFSNRTDTPDHYDRNLVGEFQYISDNYLLSLIPECFTVSNLNNLIRIFDLIYITQLDKSKSTYCSILIDELFFSLISEIYHQNAISYDGYSECGNITKICNYIHENLKNNISIDMLAKHVNLSPNYLIRIFKKSMKTTPQEYIINERLVFSKVLLSQTDLKINYIADQCGFNDTSYFSYVFKKHFNYTAREYREMKQKNK